MSSKKYSLHRIHVTLITEPSSSSLITLIRPSTRELAITECQKQLVGGETMHQVGRKTLYKYFFFINGRRGKVNKG